MTQPRKKPCLICNLPVKSRFRVSRTCDGVCYQKLLRCRVVKGRFVPSSEARWSL